MALWDAALGRMDPGVVTRLSPRFSTRTLRVEFEKDGTVQGLQCGPGQPLLVRNSSGIGPRAAKDLRPTDQLCLAPPGATGVEFGPIRSVTPAFFRDVTLYHLDGQLEEAPPDPAVGPKARRPSQWRRFAAGARVARVGDSRPLRRRP